MARTGYHDFMDLARDEFGMDYDDALEFYHTYDDFESPYDALLEDIDLEAEGYDVDWSEVADYDDMLDYGDEIEVSATVTYEEGK